MWVSSPGCARGAGFTSLHENLDTTTPGGRLVFHVFAALAEFIRELIVEGTREGLAAARANGVRLGRPPAMTPEQVRHARDLLSRPENTISSIARLLGVSRSTIYKYVPELAVDGRGALLVDCADGSLRRDQDAVTNGLSLPYSSGQVEGTVTKIKYLKRQMFGRANFDLRKRVLLAR